MDDYIAAPTEPTIAQTKTVCVPHFYWHPDTLKYEFGPNHPLRPERLRRAMVLFEAVLGIDVVVAAPAVPTDLETIHSADYVEFVREQSQNPTHGIKRHGFGPGDNPIFAGMYEASMAYVGGAVAAARAVNAGAHRGYNIAGGLHHARFDRAAGFCIFNDPAVAIKILKERFTRIAYVDIDVHHGEGVQYAFENDPDVLTCSIHQNGRTLFPGTGFVEDVGPAHTAVNVPLPPGTSGDVWLWSFREAILPALEIFQPEALVVQCGTDAHYLDPLAKISCRGQDWLGAVEALHDLNLPTVVLGGGGYNLTTVPRMWLGAVSVFSDQAIDNEIPSPFNIDWQMPTIRDPDDVISLGIGLEETKRIVAQVQNLVHANLTR